MIIILNTMLNLLLLANVKQYLLLQKLEKRFSEKPIVAFTNSAVFMVDSYIHDQPCLPLNAWTLRTTHIITCPEASAQIKNIYMQGKFLTN